MSSTSLLEGRQRVHQKLLNRRKKHWESQLRKGDAQSVIDLLDQSATGCFKQACEQVSDAAPHREFRRCLTVLFDEAVMEQVERVRADIHQQESFELQCEITGLIDCRASMERLLLRIEQGYFPSPSSPRPGRDERWAERYGVLPWWRGADVVIADEPLVGYTGKNTVVVTEYAMQLAALFVRLRDIAGPFITHLSRYEFFICTADGVNDLLEVNPQASQQEALVRAVEEAMNVLSIWQNRLERNRPWLVEEMDLLESLDDMQQENMSS